MTPLLLILFHEIKNRGWYDAGSKLQGYHPGCFIRLVIDGLRLHAYRLQILLGLLEIDKAALQTILRAV